MKTMKLPEPLVLQTMSGVFEPLTDTYNVVHKETKDGEKMLSFSVEKTERNAALFDMILPKEVILFENERYVIDPFDHSPIGMTSEKSVEARHEIFDILKAEYQTKETTGALRIRKALDLALENTGITYTFVGEDLPSENFENFGNATALDMLQQVMNRFGCEYRISGRHLTVATEIARYTDGQVRHGHNLKSISEHQDGTDIITHIEGWGRIDEETNKPVVKTVYESEHSGKYKDVTTGKKRLYKAFFQDDRFTTQEGIDAEAKRRANGVPSYHLEVEYEELVKNGLKLHDFQLGDYIWVIHEGLKLDIQARIISVERYPYEHRSPVIELGSFRRDITEKITEIEETGKEINKVSTSVAIARQTAQQASEVARSVQESVGGTNQTLSQHLSDNIRHVTDIERLYWNNKADKGESGQDAAWALNEARKYTDEKVKLVMDENTALRALYQELKERLDRLDPQT